MVYLEISLTESMGFSYSQFRLLVTGKQLSHFLKLPQKPVQHETKVNGPIILREHHFKNAREAFLSQKLQIQF